MFNKRSKEGKTKVRYGFSYGKPGERKSGNLSSISNVFYAKDKLLGINKDNNKDTGHYCIPIKYHSDGTCDVVTLTSMSVSPEKYYSDINKDPLLSKRYIVFRHFNHIYYMEKAKLHMALQGEIIPLPTDEVVWNGINRKVIENIPLDKLKHKRFFKLHL